MSYKAERFLNLASLDYAGKSEKELKLLCREVLNDGMHGLCFSPYTEGQQPGDQPGDGGPGGTTNKANENLTDGGGEAGNRQLDKKSGLPATQLPDEYRKLIDAYNKTKASK